MGAGSERTLEIILEYFAVDRTYFVLCQNCVFAIKLGDAGASKKTMDQKTQENQNHMVGPGGRGGDWTRKTTTSRIVLILRRWCFILKTSFLIQTGLMLVPEPTHFNTLKGSIQIPTNLCVCVCQVARVVVSSKQALHKGTPGMSEQPTELPFTISTQRLYSVMPWLSRKEISGCTYFRNFLHCQFRRGKSYCCSSW